MFWVMPESNIPAWWLQSSATWSNKNADDVAEEIVEKGSKKLMSTDDGRAELRDGSFNLDKTAKRIMEEGQQAIQAEGGDSQAAAQAQEGAEKVDTKEQPEVAERVKERVISMSQTS
ncbi:hypothetical protein N2152v2_005647 [Parachlorella kessleri]